MTQSQASVLHYIANSLISTEIQKYIAYLLDCIKKIEEIEPENYKTHKDMYDRILLLIPVLQQYQKLDKDTIELQSMCTNKAIKLEGLIKSQNTQSNTAAQQSPSKITKSDTNYYIIMENASKQIEKSLSSMQHKRIAEGKASIMEAIQLLEQLQ